MTSHKPILAPGNLGKISAHFLHLALGQLVISTPSLLQHNNVTSRLPGQRIVLQALVTAVLFTHVTCFPPPHVFVHSVQQGLPEIKSWDVNL